MPQSSESEVLGLSSQQALDLLETVGPNELPSQKTRSFLHILHEILREPMVFLLLGCGVIYFILGDPQEALSLIAFLTLIVIITLRQETKTERALEALRDLSSPRALVIREGKKIRIPGAWVVPGDILVLNEGDRVAADAEILSCVDLHADESLLTGEALPVLKHPRLKKGAHDLKIVSLSSPDRVYAGTTLVRGQGVAQVFATGIRTELGKIGKSLEKGTIEMTSLQKETRKLVRLLAQIAIGLCLWVMAAFAWTRRDVLGGILAGLTLAMAILPNELPAVLLIFLTTGAWRLSQRQVLTRRVSAVEILGSTTVLCVDKTGTLTLNRMSIQALWKQGQLYELNRLQRQELPEELHELVEYGILASRREPFDPMERAFHTTGFEYLKGTEHLHSDWVLSKEYPISDNLLAVSYAWRPGRDHGFVVSAKGAPEAIIDLCHLKPEVDSVIESAVGELASKGLRVLGVARAYSKDPLPSQQHDFDFEFLGLIGLADPVRPGVLEAIAECRSAGIRVMMITGDHPETARSVARQIGFSSTEEVITGPELEGMSEAELEGRLKTTHLFSRMLPVQKLKLVTILKKQGEVVGMTGDGVNDAPALKYAHIGIAMGQRGTDVAREAASLVLLNDDFSSIVAAVRLARRILLNLRNAFSYLLAIHVPITVLSIVPIAFRLPLILFPIHIAFLHLVIEPACTLVFEAESECGDVMKRPPRRADQPLFQREIVKKSLLQGLWVAAVVLAVHLIALWRGQGEAEARTLTFTTLMVANLGLLLNNRSWSESALVSLRRSNRVFGWISLGSLILLGMVLMIPSLRMIFKFSVLHPVDLLICAGAGLASVAWFDFWKRMKVANRSGQGII